LTQGAISAWTVAVSFLLAQIFAVPPYNYNSAQIGYLYGGAMVGGLLAEIFCILLNDRAAKILARRNGGVYERITTTHPRLRVELADSFM
jgi:hypothetical protein